MARMGPGAVGAVVMGASPVGVVGLRGEWHLPGYPHGSQGSFRPQRTRPLRRTSGSFAKRVAIPTSGARICPALLSPEPLMSRRQKDPLRPLTAAERRSLTARSRSPAAPAAQVARAKLLL